jgi:Protein of unknown function (DUF3237)
VSAFEPPAPGLELLARFHVELGPIQDLGTTPWGHRRIVPIAGGSFSGPRLRGEVAPGGADWQILHADGTTTIDTRYSLRTHDGALIHIRTRGVRSGPPEVIAALTSGEDVDPASYYFRVGVVLETGARDYNWLNRTLVLGSAQRLRDVVRYDAYAVT